MSLWGDDAPLGKYAQRNQTEPPEPEEDDPGPAGVSAASSPKRNPAGVPASSSPRRSPAGVPAASSPSRSPAGVPAASSPSRSPAGVARRVGRPAPSTPGTREEPLSVSAVVRAAARTIDQALGTVWVEGETVSVSRPSSGHVYFALKDQHSQLRAVMWRTDARRLGFRLEDGQHLRCMGKPGIFQRDGKFQFYASFAEPAGLGAEALALEQLKRKLAGEGLFAADRKRSLPMLPRRIGVVTSKTGAAVQDIIRTVQSRFPVPILVADTAVQGAAAPRQIVRALRAIAETDVDVVIVGRGGGSASDLSAFNDEAVVRAVAACSVPTISAVGHEIDTSLTDLVADRQASTPTRAAELAVPVLADLEQLLHKEQRRLVREMELRFRHARQELDQLIDTAGGCLALSGARRRAALRELQHRLEAQHPRAVLAGHRGELGALQERLQACIQRRVDAAGRSLAAASARLDSLSPLRVLRRGYSLTTHEDRVVTRAGDVAVGDEVTVRLAEGALDCRVEATRTGDVDESQ